MCRDRERQNGAMAGMIVRLSLSYFGCLRGKYLDCTWARGGFACLFHRRHCRHGRHGCHCGSTWPDQMGLEIA